jgi:MFS family permease
MGLDFRPVETVADPGRGAVGFQPDNGVVFRGRIRATLFYVLRLLNGVFAAAVVPTAFAMVADRSPDLVRRARQFTWLNALVFAGDLTGPLLGEISVALGATSPFLAPAALSAIALPGPSSDFTKGCPCRSRQRSTPESA